MYTHKKITRDRFTVRLCTVASYLGFTRVGPFEKLLTQMHPNNRISYGVYHTRVSVLLNEIHRFKGDEQ
jgi:hypothetical protein